jgi:hypothetical protein
MIAVVDLIGDIVAKTSNRIKQSSTNEILQEKGVFYQFGHIKEINNILVSFDKTTEYKKQKYPAILLLQDFIEKTVTKAPYVRQANLQLLIVAGSTSNNRTSQRYEKVFMPVLYPIYETFMKVLRNESRLYWEYGDIPHIKIDRPNISGFTIRQQGETKNLFSDFLDAIEINNLNINIKKLC